MFKNYTLDEIRKLIELGLINDENIKDIIDTLFDMEITEEVIELLELLEESPEIPEVIRAEISEVLESEQPELVEENVEQVELTDEGEVSELNNETGSESSETATDETVVLADETVEEVTSEDYVVESYEEINEPIITSQSEKGNSLDELLVVSSSEGLTVKEKDMGMNGGIPHITFQINNESKAYLDNLLLNLYDNKELGSFVMLSSIEATKEELLTIGIDDPNLSLEDLLIRAEKIFGEVERIIKETEKNKDYEQVMPLKLREMKDGFNNYDPNVPKEDFKTGVKDDSLYVVSHSIEKASDIAKAMGYEIKEDRGGNVFELDTSKKKNIEGTKVYSVSEDINMIDEVKEPEIGISNVDINYNRRYVKEEDSTAKILDFIHDSVNPDITSIIEIKTPSISPKQRVVTLSSTDGTRETFSYKSGGEFDSLVLPEIAVAFEETSQVGVSDIKRTNYTNDTSDYEVVNLNNTFLRMTNYPDKVVDEVDKDMQSLKVNDNVTSFESAKQKSIGVYQANSKEAAKSSFTMLLAFVIVFGIGLLLMYLLYR